MAGAAPNWKDAGSGGALDSDYAFDTWKWEATVGC
jgi:hypothetical protein